MNKNLRKADQLVRLADYDLELAKWKDAEIKLRKAIELNSKNPEAYYLLGEALCKQNLFNESLEALKAADTLLPNNARILHLTGWVNFMKGETNTGRKLMKQALVMLPEDLQIICDLAVLENKEGNDIEAKKYALMALDLNPDNPMAQEVYQAVLYFSKARSHAQKSKN